MFVFVTKLWFSCMRQRHLALKKWNLSCGLTWRETVKFSMRRRWVQAWYKAHARSKCILRMLGVGCSYTKPHTHGSHTPTVQLTSVWILQNGFSLFFCVYGWLSPIIFCYLRSFSFTFSLSLCFYLYVCLSLYFSVSIFLSLSLYRIRIKFSVSVFLSLTY